MIRARNVLRAEAACHSADVLTPTERAADRLPSGFANPVQLVYRHKAMKWGDHPALRAILLSLKGKS